MKFQRNKLVQVDKDFHWGLSKGYHKCHHQWHNPIVVHITNPLYVYAPWAQPKDWHKNWNFHSNAYNTKKIMNLVGTGHFVEFALPDGTLFPIGRPNKEVIETEQLQNIKFLMDEGKPLYGYAGKIFDDFFSGREAAEGYFESDDYHEEVRKAERGKVLRNLIMSALAEIKAYWIEQNLFDSYQIIERTFRDFGIDVHDPTQIIAPLTIPAHQTKTILPRLKFYGELKGSVTEWMGAYYQVEDSYRYDVKPTHDIEAKGVNTWLYQHQLHEPTREEKQSRFNVLEHILCYIRDIEDTRSKAQAVSRFARLYLEEYDRLDHELGEQEEPHGNIDTMHEVEELA